MSGWRYTKAIAVAVTAGALAASSSAAGSPSPGSGAGDGPADGWAFAYLLAREGAVARTHAAANRGENGNSEGAPDAWAATYIRAAETTGVEAAVSLKGAEAFGPSDGWAFRFVGRG